MLPSGLYGPISTREASQERMSECQIPTHDPQFRVTHVAPPAPRAAAAGRCPLHQVMRGPLGRPRWRGI